MAPHGIEDLVRDLEDSDEAVRKAALLGLGREKDPSTILPIRRMAAADDAAELRFLAKKVLLYLAAQLGSVGEGAPATGPAALDHSDPAARIRALHRIAAGGDAGALEAVRARVPVETDPAVRACLATALGATGGRAEIELLEALSADPDPRVRANTIEALETIGGHAAYPVFVRFVSDADNRIRANAIRALGRLGAANVTKLCLAMIRSRKAWMIESALWLLVPLAKPEAAPAFESLLAHASAEIRGRARAGLERLAGAGDAKAREVLARAPAADAAIGAVGATLEEIEALARPAPGDAHGLDAATEDERLAALRTLEAALDKDAAPALIHRLEVEPSAKVRAVLVRLIGKLGDAGLTPLLENRLKDEDGRVRANAVEAIAALVDDPVRLKCLESALRDENNRTRTNAVIALWGKAGMGPVRVMKELAGSPDKNTRLSAIYAIHQIGEAASSLLGPLVTDADPDVKQRALECRKMLGLEPAAEEAPPRARPSAKVPVLAARTSGVHARPKSGKSGVTGEVAALSGHVAASMRAKVAREHRDATRADLAEAYLAHLTEAPDAPPPDLTDLIKAAEAARGGDPAKDAIRRERLAALGARLAERKVWNRDAGAELTRRAVAAAAELAEIEAELASSPKPNYLKLLAILLGLAVALKIVMMVLG